MSTTQTDLLAARRLLVDELSRCERGAFPGSRAAKREYAAMDALSAFDAAHPEVKAAIDAEHAAEMASRYVD